MKNKITVMVVVILTSILVMKMWYEKQPDPYQFFSGDVKWLGNPLAKRWPAGEDVYARNIWDLQQYDGKIYIGSGNSANRGPAVNAGPVDIWSYKPDTREFIKEGVVNDEQIEIFKIFDGQLLIPGHDAAAPDNWDFGNYYVKTSKKWIKHRNIPKAIHVYDMLSFEGKLFAALGTHDAYGGLAVSTNNGGKWETIPAGFRRFYTLFELNGKLYASGLFRTLKKIQRVQKKRPQYADRVPLSLFEYKQGKVYPVDLGIADLFPKWPHRSVKLRRPTHFMQHLVYFGAKPANDHQYTKQLLYKMKSLGKSEKINLPNDVHPQDMIVDNKRLLLLSYLRKEDESGYENRVFTTGDLKTWIPLFEFEADTFVRSFEYLDGCLYFGMGSHVNKTGKLWPKWELSPLTGSILRSSQCIYDDNSEEADLSKLNYD